MTDLHNATWQSMDDVLQGKNESGHLIAPILFKDSLPAIEDLQDFEKVLVFVTGKVKGGVNDVRQTEVLLNEENGYTEHLPLGRSGGDFTETDIDSARVRYLLEAEGIRITKADALTQPGIYQTVFALVGEDWAEVFIVTIVVTVPLSVQHGNTTARNGETLTITLTAPNYSPQYLYVRGSRSWVLEGVEVGRITASPTSGSGFNNQWDSQAITISKPSALEVKEMITTTFRVLAQTQWVDVVVNILPLITGEWVDPLPGEEGVAGTEAIYVYF
jgi:hypothetical protein